MKNIEKRPLSKGDIKLLKKHGYHRNRCQQIMIMEAANKTDKKGAPAVPYSELKDAPPKNLIRFHNSFNPCSGAMKKFNVMYRDSLTGMVIYDYDLEAKDLYAAKAKAAQKAKEMKLTNFKTKVKYVYS